MYSEIIDYLKSHLESTVNVQRIQSGYFGDFTEINFARPAVLLEPRRDQRAAKNVRWKDGSYQVRVWIMVEIVRDYLTSMRELEQLMDPDDPGQTGVISALNNLKADDTFKALSGSTGGRAWRIGSRVMEISDTSFGIQQTASQRLNVAQVDLEIIFEIEK